MTCAGQPKFPNVRFLRHLKQLKGATTEQTGSRFFFGHILVIAFPFIIFSGLKTTNAQLCNYRHSVCRYSFGAEFINLQVKDCFSLS